MKIPEPKQQKSGNWRIQIMIGGEKHSITKTTPEKCKAEAERLVILHEEGIKPARIVSVRLGDAIDNYIEARSKILSPSTVRAYKAYRKSRFQVYMNRPVSSIDWQKMINTEAGLDITPKTIKNAWGLVKASLSDVGIEVDVRLPAPIPHEKIWLTPEQIPLFMDAIKGEKVEIGALLALSGLRRSEIYGLDWSDIDLDKKEIHVHQSKMLDEDAKPVVRKQNKNYTSTRTVPIFLPRLYDALSGVSEREGCVIKDNLSTLRKRITRACEKAGLPDVGVHGLRHSFCSLCYSLGISEKACMELGGWSDYQTMRKIYTHISEADKKASATALEEFFTSPKLNFSENANPQSTAAEPV